MTRSRTLFTIVGAGCLAAIPMGESLVYAGVPNVMTQEGLLLDKSTGSPVSGTLTFTFQIWDSATGGTSLWKEGQPITLDGGYFSAQLGSATPIPANIFDAGKPLFLGVTIGSDPELSPRETMTSVPYAFVAGNVNGDITPTSVTVAGLTVIKPDGSWGGAPTGLAGPTGPTGPTGATGPSGSAGPSTGALLTQFIGNVSPAPNALSGWLALTTDYTPAVNARAFIYARCSYDSPAVGANVQFRVAMKTPTGSASGPTVGTQYYIQNQTAAVNTSVLSSNNDFFDLTAGASYDFGINFLPASPAAGGATDICSAMVQVFSR